MGKIGFLQCACLLTSATPKSDIFSVPSVAKSKFPGLICRYCQGNQSLQILTVPAKFQCSNACGISS